MKKYAFTPLLLAVAISACTQTSTTSESPAPEKTLSSGIDTRYYDESVPAQEDFFHHINGEWLKTTEIPADKSNYGSFTKLADDAEKQIHEILEEAAAMTDTEDADLKKIGAYYSTYMDTEKAEAMGIEPLKPLFARIDAVSSTDAMPILWAQLLREGVNMPLYPYVHQNPKNSNEYSGDFWQTGLSLPNRDYYLIEDEKFSAIREAYLTHLETMMTMADMSAADEKAKAVLALETSMAEYQWDKVDNRNPQKRYNPYPASELSSVSPAIDWTAYLNEVGYGDLEEILLSQPSYVTGLGTLLEDVSLDDWKTYMKWQVLTSYAGLLSEDFVAENFAFFSGTLNGIEENRPRWKRAVGATEGALGEAIGKRYVELYFPPENKARMEQMVKNLISAYDIAIRNLSWMSDETKQAALTKLNKFTYKIGYPDEWRDYTALQVIKGDLVGNSMRSAAFSYDREINKLGGPVDRNEWGMTPQTVNAYYNPQKNEIVFPAAILQPPFFNVDAEDAVNYGGIGAVIGHEISHGFDDQGSQYDGDGNLEMWWTEEDRAKFEALASQLAAQYDQYEPVPGYFVNGKFTLGENIADLGGLTIAHQAYLLSLDGKDAPVIEGMTGDQRLFAGWGQIWRRKYREENLLNRLKTDPHSPSEYRANGVVTNIPQFYSAYDVEPEDGMYTEPEERIKIW